MVTFVAIDPGKREEEKQCRIRLSGSLGMTDPRDMVAELIKKINAEPGRLMSPIELTKSRLRSCVVSYLMLS